MSMNMKAMSRSPPNIMKFKKMAQGVPAFGNKKFSVNNMQSVQQKILLQNRLNSNTRSGGLLAIPRPSTGLQTSKASAKKVTINLEDLASGRINTEGSSTPKYQGLMGYVSTLYKTKK